MFHLRPTKDEERMQKTFIRCYTIALKCQFCFIMFLKLQLNKNLTPLSQNVEKNNKGVHLMLVLTYLF